MESRRLLSAGQPDLHFGQGGVAYGELWAGYGPAAAALESDGKIVAVGNSTEYFRSGSIISRFNADGSVDRSFGKQGVVKFYLGDHSTSSGIYGVVVQPDNKIVVLANDSLGVHLFRFLPSGSLDCGFGSVRFSFADGGNGNAMVLEHNGDIIVGDGKSGCTLAAFTPAGKFDKSFGTGGIAN